VAVPSTHSTYYRDLQIPSSHHNHDRSNSNSMALSKELSTKVLEAVAVVGTGLAAGFTLYISTIEIPSRKGDTGAFCLAQYQHLVPSVTALLKGSFGMALNAVLASVVYTTRNKRLLWWVPFISISAMSPLTFYGPMANMHTTLMGMKTIMLKTPDDDKEAKNKVEQWGRLHHVRTGLSVIAFATSVMAALDLGSL
jgi:hypothetical protein